MNEVGRGEALCQDGIGCTLQNGIIGGLTSLGVGSDQIEAAVCFYKALKVYPAPGGYLQVPSRGVHAIS